MSRCAHDEPEMTVPPGPPAPPSTMVACGTTLTRSGLVGAALVSLVVAEGASSAAGRPQTVQNCSPGLNSWPHPARAMASPQRLKVDFRITAS